MGKGSHEDDPMIPKQKRSWRFTRGSEWKELFASLNSHLPSTVSCSKETHRLVNEARAHGIGPSIQP